MSNIEVVGLVFQSIKQNWAKNGSFQSLVEMLCQRLEITFSQEVCDFLKEHDALWLNNHLEEPMEEEMSDERLEADNVMLDKSEMVKEPLLVVNSQRKNHDYH